MAESTEETVSFQEHEPAESGYECFDDDYYDEDWYVAGRKAKRNATRPKRDTPKGKKPSTTSQVQTKVRHIVKDGSGSGTSSTEQLENCVEEIKFLRATHARREVKNNDFKVCDLKREITRAEMKNKNFVAQKENAEKRITKMDVKRFVDIKNDGLSNVPDESPRVPEDVRCWCGEVHKRPETKLLEYYLQQLVEMRLIEDSYVSNIHYGTFTYNKTQHIGSCSRRKVKSVYRIKKHFPCVDFDNL